MLLEFIDVLFEGFSGFKYRIPEDKEKLLFDFYMLVGLPEPQDEKLQVA